MLLAPGVGPGFASAHALRRAWRCAAPCGGGASLAYLARYPWGRLFAPSQTHGHDDKREGSNYFDGQSSLYGIVALKTKVQRGPVVWFESLRRSPLEFSAQVTLDVKV